MTNVTVQEALKSAIEVITKAAIDYDYHEAACDCEEIHKLKIKALTKCKAALADIEKCEPVAEAIRERDRLGFAVVNVIGKLDEIIENTQEVEIDDFLHIAVPIDMWNELQAALEDMPKRADLYTSPQPRDWVGLNYPEILDCLPEGAKRVPEGWQEFYEAIEAKLKQLNTEG